MIGTSQDELLVTNEGNDDRSRSPYSDIGNIICDCRCKKAPKSLLCTFYYRLKTTNIFILLKFWFVILYSTTFKLYVDVLFVTKNAVVLQLL